MSRVPAKTAVFELVISRRDCELPPLTRSSLVVQSSLSHFLVHRSQPKCNYAPSGGRVPLGASKEVEMLGRHTGVDLRGAFAFLLVRSHLRHMV